MPFIDGVQRRFRLEHNIPAELAIRAAVTAVEDLGEHPKLVEARAHLLQALTDVADAVDGVGVAAMSVARLDRALETFDNRTVASAAHDARINAKDQR